MSRQLSQIIVQNLWHAYFYSSPDMQRITETFIQMDIPQPPLDHFAVIDLPGPYSGISELKQIFSELGFVERGKDYLAEKQNDFLWMAEADCIHMPAAQVLPQVVVADFRLDEMPPEIRKIIYHYSQKTNPFAVTEILTLLRKPADKEILSQCKDKILNYLTGRDWPLPLASEFNMVREFNELLAWVLVFGRKPNHFTLSIHLTERFKSLDDFHHFIEQEAKLRLHQEGGVIKGGEKAGIAQGSTAGISKKVMLADGEITIPTGFVEFVWRYSRKNEHQKLWGDYFTDFIATQANRVIESLYD